MPHVSIILPAYNEAAAIGPVLDALRALPIDAELIVVDDCSSDETSAVAAQHGARVVRHALNLGYGRSLKDGIHAATTDVIIISDADGTYPIERIPALLETFNKGFDMVVGARQGSAYKGSFFKRIGRWFLKLIVEFTAGRSIPDINSGFRIFRKSTAQPFFPDICEGFSFTTTITLVYLLTHRTINYMPIEYHKRVGSSKVRLLRDTLRTLQYVTECIVRYNPLKIFVALAVFVLAVGAIGWIFMGAGSFILSIFAATVVFALGLIAETQRRPRQ